jgi:hypothetical protein
MIMSKTKPAAIMALTMVSLVAFGGPSMAQTPAPANPAQEEAFLDVLPKIEVPDDVQPIPGAVNEKFKTCRAFWPKGYDQAQSGPEARALRDIYSLVRAGNVISTKECTCPGKVASWEDVEMIAERLRGHLGIKKLEWRDTNAISAEAKRLMAVAAIMCGGNF